MVILMNVTFWYCVDILEELHNSGEQFFSSDQCMILQNHAVVKDPFKGEGRLI